MTRYRIVRGDDEFDYWPWKIEAWRPGARGLLGKRGNWVRVRWASNRAYARNWVRCRHHAESGFKGAHP